jgi:hypothetical protein
VIVVNVVMGNVLNVAVVIMIGGGECGDFS